MTLNGNGFVFARLEAKDRMPETYNEEAIQQILKFAMSRQGREVDLTRSQLKEIAQELGISDENLTAAERDWDIQRQEQDDREAFDQYRHLRLRQGIVRCLAVNTVLTLINVTANHTVSWAVYPTLVWSCLLTLQAWRTYQYEGEEYHRAFRRWKLGQQIGESFKALTERLNRTLSQSSENCETGSSGHHEVNQLN